MDKKLVLGVAALIVAVAGGWYLLAKAPVPTDNQPAAAGGAVMQQQSTGTLNNLLAMGPSECQVTLGDGSQGQGTVYVANGKMSGDFSTVASSTQIHTYLINDGTNIYTWSDQSAEGVEMPATAMASSSATGESQGVSGSTAVQYSCSPWAEDDSLFAPPASVTFMMVGAGGQ